MVALLVQVAPDGPYQKRVLRVWILPPVEPTISAGFTEENCPWGRGASSPPPRVAHNGVCLLTDPPALTGPSFHCSV
ncbi:hypothetical protein OIU85_020710 [Salix viminalis]|uniref:Uncharacterized protein n=1 Tax=Salix viminalis TaxID=40686 RepID=A0A9Q0UH07_SALVM|nr:hypothetical protein OIU85_020710 [Salix viminalis]